MPARIGKHVRVTATAATGVGACETCTRSALLQELLGMFARQEHAKQREIDTWVWREPALARTFAGQAAEIKSLAARDAAFDTSHRAKCQQC